MELSRARRKPSFTTAGSPLLTEVGAAERDSEPSVRSVRDVGRLLAPRESTRGLRRASNRGRLALDPPDAVGCSRTRFPGRVTDLSGVHAIGALEGHPRRRRERDGDRAPHRSARAPGRARLRGDGDQRGAAGQGLPPRVRGRSVGRDGPAPARLPDLPGARARSAVPRRRLRRAAGGAPAQRLPRAGALLRRRRQQRRDHDRLRPGADRRAAQSAAGVQPALDRSVRLRLRGPVRHGDRAVGLHPHRA